MKAGTFVVKWSDPSRWAVTAEGMYAGAAPPWAHRAALSESKAIDLEEALNALSQEALDAGGVQLVARVVDRVVLSTGT